MRGSKKWDRLDLEIVRSLDRIHKAIGKQRAMLRARCGAERLEKYEFGPLYDEPTLLMLFPASLDDAVRGCMEHRTMCEESAASMERMAAEGGAE